MRRYPLFSSPLNNISQHEEKKEDEKKPAGGDLEEDPDLTQVSTLFEEQNSIETLLSEIREIENTMSEPQLDIASLVSLRTVNNVDLSQNRVAGPEDENISLTIDLRSNPDMEVLTVF